MVFYGFSPFIHFMYIALV